MKVVCIDDTKWIKGFVCPSFMEACTVSASCAWEGIPVYSFYEYPPPFGYAFRYFSQKYFTPISDTDETELVNERIYAGDNLLH